MLRSLTPWLLALLAAVAAAQPASPPAPSADDSLVLAARDAFRATDRNRLATLREQALRQQHPLASWFDYWELNARLREAQQPELDAFYARWPGIPNLHELLQ